MKISKIIKVLITLFILLGWQLNGEEKVLKVATRQSPPFSFKDNNGLWRGLSIDLWRELADELNYKYEFYDTTLKDLLEGLRDGRYDVGVAGLTITSEREKILTFTQPFISSSMGVAYFDNENPWMEVVKHFISFTFLKIVLFLIAVLLLAGFGVWLFERKKNEEFGKRTHHGLASAFWWAAVTMTTVGYGDKAPRTLGGRIIGIIWMFASVIILTSFTASFVSTLTLASEKEKITFNDIKNKRIGTIDNSTGEKILIRRNIIPLTFDTCEEMISALREGKINYIVYDLPMLRYFGVDCGEDFEIIPLKQYRQDYGLATQIASPLLKHLNIELLSFIHTPNWYDIKNNYLGTWASDFEAH